MHAHEYNAMFGSRQSILYPPLLVVKPILAALIGANMRAQNVSNCTSTEEPVPADLLRAGANERLAVARKAPDCSRLSLQNRFCDNFILIVATDHAVASATKRVAGPMQPPPVFTITGV